MKCDARMVAAAWQAVRSVYDLIDFEVLAANRVALA